MCCISCFQPHPDWSIRPPGGRISARPSPALRMKRKNVESDQLHHPSQFAPVWPFVPVKAETVVANTRRHPPPIPILKPDQQGNILQPFIRLTNSSEMSFCVHSSAIATWAVDERKPPPLILRTGNETMAETILSHIETIVTARVRNVLWMMPLLSRHA